MREALANDSWRVSAKKCGGCQQDGNTTQLLLRMGEGTSSETAMQYPEPAERNRVDRVRFDAGWLRKELCSGGRRWGRAQLSAGEIVSREPMSPDAESGASTPRMWFRGWASDRWRTIPRTGKRPLLTVEGQVDLGNAT